MKRLILLLIASALVVSSTVFSQDRSTLRAASLAFNSAERDYNKGDYKEAAQKFDMVVNAVPATCDSRKHLEMRLESLINLVDIYFNKSVNIRQACEYMHTYQSTMNTVSNSGVLRARSLMKFAKQSQDYANNHASKCESYERIGGDKKKFEKSFEDEFKKR
ncbi:MAG: hypothetical protein R6U65_00690 [Perlabentimonas sp.]